MTDALAPSLADWAEDLEAILCRARPEWRTGELYAAFRAVMAAEGRELPDWEEIETLLEEQARLRRIYAHLIPFLETPDAYAQSLERKAEALVRDRHLSPVEARAQVAAEALEALTEEVEMAYGERATPDLYRAYVQHLESGGDNFVLWMARWLSSAS